MTGTRICAELVQASDSRTRMLQGVPWSVEQRFHERHIGHRVQRTDLDGLVAADCDLPLRARERFLESMLSGEAEATCELQFRSLARGPLGAFEPRGLV